MQNKLKGYAICYLHAMRRNIFYFANIDSLALLQRIRDLH